MYLHDKVGRPEKPIDWDKVDHLLVAGCTGTECAAYFNVHSRTFYHRIEEKYGVCFTDYASEKREKGKSILRVKQFEKAAVDKDNTMLIWLGKNILDQRDTAKVELHAQVEVLQNLLKEITDTSKDLIDDPERSE